MKYYIFGAGGLCLEVISIIADIKSIDLKDIILVVDNQYLNDSNLPDFEIISIQNFNQKRESIILAVGDPLLRKSVVNKNPNFKISNSIIHPSAKISPFAKIGIGNIIFPNVVIGPEVVLGDHCVIYSNTSINHHVNIESFVTIASNVSINGRCDIKEGVFIGANASLKQNVSVGERSIIGMGSVVLKNVGADQIVVGNPAKFIENRTTKLF